MLRRLLGMALMLSALAGCTKLGGECQSAADCAQGQVCEAGFCFTPKPVNPPPVEPDKCEPACTALQTCTTEGCRASFTGLTLLAPTAGTVLTGGPVTVRAQLTRAYDVAAFPSVIGLSVTPVGGTETALTPVTANGDGTYTAEWTPPAGEAEYDVKAVYADAGLSATPVRVKVDTVGPTFTVSLPGVATPPAANGFTYAQPSSAEAFRRDQSVVLTVQSMATDVDPATFKVTVRGVNGGPDLTNLTFTDCAGVPFCKQATVNLWEPGLNAFRGTFAVEVEGKDLVGNAGVRAGAAGIPVTRWRWAFAAGSSGDIKGTPAVGERGVVYVGTASSSSSGNVIAIAPEGSVKWQKGLGAVGGSPSVGKPRGAEEYVYVGATGDVITVGAQFYALKGSSGETVAQCPGTTGGLGGNLIESAIAVGTTDATGQYETAMGIYNVSSASARIVSVRPDVGTVPTDKCGSESSSSTPIPHAQPGASVAMRDADIFYGTVASNVTSYTFESRTPRTNWPSGTTTFARGLALLGDNVLGAAASGENKESGGVFTVPQASPPASATFVYPSATPNSRVFNLVIGGGSQAYFGAETNAASTLVRMDAATPATRTSSSNTNVGTLQAAPVVGRNGLLYTVNTGGQVQAWAADTLSSRWDISLPGNPQLASPTLDCLRDAAGAQLAGATVGALYVPVGANLYSFIVDSPALEASPWPKYQRDARNSGNPATPITSCQ